MAEILAHDFGKEQREHVRRFARLTGILEAHEAEVLADPIKHLRLAAERLAEMQSAVQRARNLLYRPVSFERDFAIPERMDVVTIDKAEYLRLRAAEATIIALADETG